MASILKIIINRSVFNNELDNHKFIFVGKVPYNIYLILQKLENGKSISSQEDTQLNNTIPYYKTKFDKLDGYKLHFVYTTIFNNVNSTHLDLFILDLLRHKGVLTSLAQLKEGGVMYSFPRYVAYTAVFDLVEYLFKDSHEVTGLELHKTLIANQILPDTVTIENLDLKPEIAYKAYELANNQSFIKYFMALPVIYAPRKYRKVPTVGNIETVNYQYSYEAMNFFQPFAGKTTANKFSDSLIQYSFFDMTEYTLVSNRYAATCVNYENNSTNNTIYYYLGTDISDWLSKLDKANNNFRIFATNYCKKYRFTDQDSFTRTMVNNRRNFRICLTDTILTDSSKHELEKHTGITQNLQRFIEKESCLQVEGKIENRHMVFDSYDLGIDTAINMIQLFQEIETNYYLPLVKFVSGGEVQLYNIYNPFFRNLDDKVIALYLHGKDILSQFYEDIPANQDDPRLLRLKTLRNNDYLVFKWRLDDKNIMNIYLFENGYVLTEFQNAMFMAQEAVLGYLALLKKIINKIKKNYKIIDLPLANPESLLKHTAGNINYCDLINLAVKIPLKLNPRIAWAYYTGYMMHGKSADVAYKSADDFYAADTSISSVFNHLVVNQHILDKIHDKLLLMPNVLVIRKNNDEISFLSTDTYGFYSQENIKHFMRNYLRKKGDRISNAEKDKMFLTVEKIFKLDKSAVEAMFESLEQMEITSKFDFSYHLDCKLKINKPDSEFVLFIDNITQQNITDNLVSQLNTIVRDCIFGLEQVFDYASILTEYESISDLFTIKSVSAAAAAPAHGGHQPAAKGVDVRQPSLSRKGKIDMADLANMDISELLDIGYLADFNIEEDVGLGLDIDKIAELEIDLDRDAIEKLAEIEQEPVFAPVEPEEGYQDLKLKQLVGKKEKLTIVNYMKDMRKHFDQPLYEPVVKGKVSDYSYDRSNCPKTLMRQPFIVTKEQLKEIDPESITGYLKYRGNYYICPRLWDAKVNKPISVRAFIAAGLKSPYTGSLPILNSPNKNRITDKYSVIVRKPTTSTYWSDPTVHKDWPDILKRTEKDAYPALTYSSKHPKGWCVPCCFINQPEDFDPTKKEMQQIMKPFHYQICDYKPETDDDITGAGGTKTPVDDEKQAEEYCSNDEYIANANTNLKNCRLGLLPEELNVLLNNSQELFLNTTETALVDGANVFLRHGIIKNNITNILDSFASILKMKTERLINRIYNKLSPMEFIELNNSKLIDVFSSSADYPIHMEDRNKFQRFIGLYNSLLENLAFDRNVILSWLDEPNDNTTTMVHVRILYKIYSAYYNYLAYLASPNEIKSYEYVIQIFTKPRKWLFPMGANIIIFDKNIFNIRCLDEFNYRTDKLIIMIEEQQNYFIPVVHVQMKFGRITISSEIKLDINLNLNDSQVSSLIKKRPNQQKLIEQSADRLSSLVKLLYVQSGLCSYNLIFFNRKLIKSLDAEKIQLVTQFTGIGSGIFTEYIQLDKQLVLPIYPTFNIRKTQICDYTDMFKLINQNQLTASSLLDIFYATPNKYHMLFDYNYHITEFHIEKIKNKVYITQCRFENGLLLPLALEEYNERSMEKQLVGINRKFGRKIDVLPVVTTNLLKQEAGKTSGVGLAGGTGFILNVYSLLNLLTHQIKNNLSYYLYKANSKKSEQISRLIDIIYNPNKARLNELDYFQLLDDVLQNIIHVENTGILEYAKNYFMDRVTKRNKLTNRGFTKKLLHLVCRKPTSSGDDSVSINNTESKPKHQQTQKLGRQQQQQRTGGDVNMLCIRDGLSFKIRIPAEIYEYILMSIGKDLLNNKMESDTIVKGRYIIPLDDVITTRLINTIYTDNNEFQRNIIISPEEMSYYLSKNILSKYRRNFKVKEDSRQVISNMTAEDIMHLTGHVIGEIKGRIVGGLTDIFSSISSGSDSNMEQYIYTTVFNHDGLLNTNATHGQCIFPYKNAKGSIMYQCGQASELLTGQRMKSDKLLPQDSICPTSLNKDKTVDKWGYCPEKPEITHARMTGSVESTSVVKDAYDPITLKKIGNCQFPFMIIDKRIVNPLTGAKPLIQINFKCATAGPNPITNGTWCYTRSGLSSDTENDVSFSSKSMPDVVPSNSEENTASNGDIGNNKIKLLLGVRGSRHVKNNIYKGAWTLGGLYDEKGGFNVKSAEAIYEQDIGLTKAACEIKTDDTKREKIEKNLELDDVVPIDKDSYSPDYCKLPVSKKGYTRKQLYVFGRDVLGIHYKSMLNESRKILDKNELCTMFNQKIRDIKKAETLAAAGITSGMTEDEIKRRVYAKDPTKCLDGPTKGGYKLSELRDMAITYFGLTETDVAPLSKDELCKHITQQLNIVESSDVDIDEIKEIYPANRNVDLCSKPIGRGGISKKKVNEIASKLNIDIRGKSKSELCRIIKSNLEKKTEKPIVQSAKHANDIDTGDLVFADKSVDIKSKMSTGININKISDIKI